MKKALLIVTTLALAVGASSIMAEQTNWAGTYWGDPTGIAIQGSWQGTLFVNEPEGSTPYFKGAWVSDDGANYGKLYADLMEDGSGIYVIVNGLAYDKKGILVGNWYGGFNLSVDPGKAKGDWASIDGAHYGFWKGIQVD